MIFRPVDEAGDILPVLSASDLLTGARAEAELVRNRLKLLTGEWWENPEWGNGILELHFRVHTENSRRAGRPGGKGFC